MGFARCLIIQKRIMLPGFRGVEEIAVICHQNTPRDFMSSSIALACCLLNLPAWYSDFTC